MQNTDLTVVRRYDETSVYGPSYSAEVYTSKALSLVDRRSYNRQQRRPRPKVLSVASNTPSSYCILRYISLQTAKTGPLVQGYRTQELRWNSPISIDTNNSDSASLGRITSMTELMPVIQNKILSDVVSGKAQLATDLVELNKTKSMFASAGLTLFKAFRDLRAGRPFRQFALAMQKDGFSGLVGKKWLEFIYGWAPTVSGAFETAEVLSQKLQAGLVVRGKVKARQKMYRANRHPNFAGASYEAYCDTTARGYYEYTVRDPKLLRLSQLGFTNPLAIAWELTPWSFVLDWFVDVGGYISRMDFALGISNFSWQYGCFQRCRTFVTYFEDPSIPGLSYRYQPGVLLITEQRNERHKPTGKIVNTFRGFKRFTNETVRLTSAVALIDQQRRRLKRLSLQP